MTSSLSLRGRYAASLRTRSMRPSDSCWCHSTSVTSSQPVGRRPILALKSSNLLFTAGGAQSWAGISVGTPWFARSHRAPSAASSAQTEYYATCFPGLEEVVAKELSSPLIRAQNVVPAKAGVTFNGDKMVGYRANLWLRSAIRVLTLLARGRINPNNSGAAEIYNFTRNSVDWPTYLYTEDMHFSVTGHAAECSDIRGGMLVSTRIKDAVCDDIRSKTGVKPVPAPKGQEPEIQLVAVAFRDTITLYRNMSGTSLHRRGYRQAMHKAALNEATAAGILYLMDWDKISNDMQSPILVDPMCGSGTFLIEAALMAQRFIPAALKQLFIHRYFSLPILLNLPMSNGCCLCAHRKAPGLFRSSWPFETWHDHNKDLWDQVVQEAVSKSRDWDGQIWGSDIHEGALWLAKQDSEEAGVDDIVKLKLGSVAEMNLPKQPTIVMTNPPWGLRLEGEDQVYEQGRHHAASKGRHDDSQLKQTWIQLGLFLKRECRNSTVGVLNGGHKGITRELCLRAERRYPLTVGGVDARLLKYKILPPKTEDLRD